MLHRISISRTTLAWLCGLAFVVPVVWLLVASFARAPLSGDLLASEWTLANYRITFEESSLPRWLLVSIFVCSAQTLLTLLLCTLGGFALAKYRFPGRRLLMAFMLGTMLLPAQVLLPAAWNVVRSVGLLDSWLAIIVPGAVNVFGLFLFKQSIAAIPDELLAAGRIDGCSEWRLWWNIILPLLRPISGVFCLLSFVSAWNSFLWPQIVLLDDHKYTLAIGLANLSSLAQAQANLGPMLAATVIGVLPVAALFFLIHRDFMAGITSGAVKG
jgi:ABC-type glycerol-3-phosphate transport system permease component